MRNLREIKLYEFSLVTFPANEQATVTAIKQDEGGFIVPDDIAKKLNEDIRSGKTRWEMVTRVHVPAEAKPWRAVRRGERWYVYKLDADGEPTGDALGEHDTEDEAQAQVRALYANEKNPKGGDPILQHKIGRTISAATLAKLKAARDVIDELWSQWA